MFFDNMSRKYDTNTTASELVSDYADLIADKSVLVTGVSPGSLGAFFVKSLLVSKPAYLLLADRDPSKLKQTADEITASHPNVHVRTLAIDLASLDSVLDVAAQVTSWDIIPAIDVLVNNAGVMALDYSVSPNGFEYHLAANHLGPFLFTNLIIDKILASESPRIVFVSSDGHRLNPTRFVDFNFDANYHLLLLEFFRRLS